MRAYRLELASTKGSIEKFPSKKRGHPYLLGETLDTQVQHYLKHIREAGAVVNSAITIAVAEGIVKSHDSNMLECNGGHICLTKSWAKSLLKRMG